MKREATSFIPTLTGIRAYAAIIVLLFHQDFLVGIPIARNGYMGVDLFFILSGYIISHVYLHEMTFFRWSTVGVFLWHRLIRLLPVHVFILTVLATLIYVARLKGVQFQSNNWPYDDLIWQFLLLHAWGVTQTATWNMPSWSISAEWFAYILFPLVALLLPRIPRSFALAFALVPIVIAALVFQRFGWNVKEAWAGAPALIRVESEFICGALLYRAQVFEGSNPVSIEWSDAVLIFGAFSLFMTNDEFLIIGCYALLCFGASGGGPLACFLFGSRPIIWLGEISYSIYMVHFAILLLLRKMGNSVRWDNWPALPHFAANVAAIILVMASAAAVFYIIERPTRKRLRDVFGKIRTSRSDPISGLSAKEEAPSP